MTEHGDGRPLPRFRTLIRPVRRALTAALVDEEGARRTQAGDDLRAQLEAVQAELGDPPLDARPTRGHREPVDATTRPRRVRSSPQGRIRRRSPATQVQKLTELVTEQERAVGPPASARWADPARRANPPSTRRRRSRARRAVRHLSGLRGDRAGPRAEVAEQHRQYIVHFRRLAPIVDLGGRGEFLELATWMGMTAYGVDLDTEAVEACKALGLDARHEDLFIHLAGLEDASVGGVFCAQVVEHLDASTLWPLLGDVGRVLTPGGAAVFETPNPASFATHVHSFWRDPTHVRPVPVNALTHAARLAGLVVEETIYGGWPPDHERLQKLEITTDDVEMRYMVKLFNEQTMTLNDLLFGPQNYAVVCANRRDTEEISMTLRIGVLGPLPPAKTGPGDLRGAHAAVVGRRRRHRPAPRRPR